MTRTAKIGCAAAMVVVLGLGGLGGTIVFYLVSAAVGASEANQGYAAMRVRDYDGAIAHFDDALRATLSSGQRAYIYMNRGAAHNEKHQFDEGIRDLTEAIRLNPTFSYAFIDRGWAYLEKKEIERALSDFNDAIRLDPNAAYAYQRRGQILYDRKEYAHALSDFNEAVRCRPSSAQDFVMRGLCYEKLGDLDRALANLDAAILLDPRNTSAWLERGKLYQQKGQADKGAADLAEARRLTPPKTYSSQPSKSSSTPKLPPEFERNTHLGVAPLPKVATTSALGPGHTFAGLLAQADAAYDSGDFEGAIRFYDGALSMDISRTNASLAVMRRGNAHLKRDEIDAAMADYEEAIRLNPGNAAAYDNRALAFNRTGDSESEMKDYSQALLLDPNDKRAYLNRGAAFFQAGNFDDALKDLTAAAQLDPNNAAAKTSIAAVYSRKGEYQEAIRECDRALKLDPASFGAHLQRAIANARLHNWAAAKMDLQKAARARSTTPGAAPNAVAWIEATGVEPELRDGKAATRLAEQACEMTGWKEWRYVDTLAAAYAESGKYDDASKFEDAALKMAYGNQKRIDSAKHRLLLYQQHKPYREDETDQK